MQPRKSLAAALALAGAVACSNGGTAPPPVNELAALNTAIGSVNAARLAISADVTHVTKAAETLDRADSLGATGNRQEMRPVRAVADVQVPRARAALARLPGELATYTTALGALETATERSRLTDGQRAALTTVVASGVGERIAADRFARDAKVVWPEYDALDQLERTWLLRARGGWYRDREESADAYAVLVGGRRPTLERARLALSRADAVRAQAAAAMGSAVADARSALETLSG